MGSEFPQTFNVGAATIAIALLLSALPARGDQHAADARALIASRCLKCHGGVRERGRLNLHGIERASRPAASGLRAIVPGDPDASELLRRIASADPDERMPAEGPPLTAAEQSMMREWILAGAPDSPHWSFTAPTRHEPPAERADPWCRQRVDAFILAALRSAGLEPSTRADRATLLRRASLDLTGLPPTLDELEAFLADETPDAFERQVDRLLASPSFGERWAARWLDLARYADTQGYEKDLHRTIWAYRDWVIEALNTNIPFDRFTRMQLAGDLLVDATESDRVATAFHRNTLNNTEGGTDNEEFRMAAVMDRVGTTWNAWLGLTMQCVQCHSHPYDDLAHVEYYASLDFLNQQADADTDDDAPLLALTRPSGATTVPVLQELPAEARRVTHRLERGSQTSPAEPVKAGMPAALNPFDPSWPGDRRGLAEWILSPANPLAARVAVNRAWEALFSTGLVASSEDFGVMGTRPSHPELLDDLAVRFREGGWNFKGLLRELVLSATYAQDSSCSGPGAAIDPENQLLWHAPRYRLEAEAVRDSALLVAGLLSGKRGGPPVMPPQPDGIWNIVYNGAKWTTSEGEDRHRRAIYTYLRRSAPYPSLMTMDAVDRLTCTVRRIRTNTPLAALATLNDPAFVECAIALARRAVAATPASAESEAVAIRHAWLWRAALGRDPSAAELSVLGALHEREVARFAAQPQAVPLAAGGAEDAAAIAPLASVASAILNTDEFLTRH